MSSKKKRMKLKQLRVNMLVPMAVAKHYSDEQNRLYFKDLEEAHISYDMPIDRAMFLIQLIKQKWFGYAVAKALGWKYGYIKLKFTAYSNGKIRAKDIIVKEL